MVYFTVYFLIMAITLYLPVIWYNHKNNRKIFSLGLEDDDLLPDYMLALVRLILAFLFLSICAAAALLTIILVDFIVKF